MPDEMASSQASGFKGDSDARIGKDFNQVRCKPSFTLQEFWTRTAISTAPEEAERLAISKAFLSRPGNCLQGLPPPDAPQRPFDFSRPGDFTSRLQKRTSSPSEGAATSQPRLGHNSKSRHSSESPLDFRHDVIHTQAKSKICNVQWQADGARALQCHTDSLQLCDIYAGTYLSSLAGSFYRVLAHPKEGNIFALLGPSSPDPKLLLFDSRIPWGDTAATKSIAGSSKALAEHQFSNLKDLSLAMTWRPDGNAIVCCDKSDTIEWVDIRMVGSTGQRKFQIRSDGASSRNEEINRVAFDRTGELLLFATGRGTVEVFPTPLERSWESISESLGQKENLLAVKAHAHDCISVATSPIGPHFATGGADQSVCLFDVRTFNSAGSLPRTGGPVMETAINHDGTILSWFCDVTEEEGALPFVSFASISPFEFLLRGPAPSTVMSLRLAARLVGIHSSVVSWHPTRNILIYGFERATTSSSASHRHYTSRHAPKTQPGVGVFTFE